MAFALVANVGAATGGSTTTGAANTTGANLIVICIGANGVVVAPSDSKGNTWTALTQRTSGAVGATQIFYCLNPTVGSGHTFTSGGGFPTVTVTAWSGAATSSVFDVETGATSASASSLATGSVTPANANSLVIASVGISDAMTGTAAITGGFTVSNAIYGQPGVTEGGGQAYLIQTSAAAANPTWSGWSPAGSCAAAIAVFKAAAGGPAFIAAQGLNIRQAVKRASYY